MHHHVGHIAVNKHLARVQPRDLIGRYAAVGTTNPQILGRLLLGQLLKKAGALLLHARGPDPVVVNQVLQ